MKLALGLDSSSEISFLASHLYELDFSSLLSPGVSEVGRALCDPDLKLKDENCLVDLIVRLCDEDEEYYCLFRYVELGFGDPSHLNVYLERVYPDHFDEGVWSCLCRCLHCQFDPKSLHLSLA